MGNIIVDPNRPWLGGNIQGGDPNTYCPEIWDFLIDKFKPQSIFDIGCGEGHLMEYFFLKGITVYGVDGLQVNKDNAKASVKDSILVHDYTTGTHRALYPDMVISCEFVEHVDEKFMHNYLSHFINCKVLAFTHAVPEQGGYHHVNCQTDDYWIDLITLFGFTLSLYTCQGRKLIPHNPYWKNILIFEK